MIVRIHPLLLIGGVLLGLSACQNEYGESSIKPDDTDKNIEIAKAMYTTLVAGDMGAAFALMADDITWTYYGGAEQRIPFSGTYTGHEGVAAFFGDYGAVAEPLGMEMKDFQASGDVVYVTGIEKSRISATGKEYAAPWVHVIKIKEGKIKSYEEYIDSALVAEAFE